MAVNTKIKSCSALALLMLMTACAADRSEVHVTQAVQKFHAQYNDGFYDAIYDEAHEKLRDRFTREEFKAKLRSLDAEFGKVQHTKSLTAWTQ